MPEPSQTTYPLFVLLIALLVCFAAQAAGAGLTFPNLGWYATLTKPGFTPPNSIFPIVWTILYAVMAVAAWIFWRAAGKEEDRRLGLIWFGIQLVLGVLWSAAFFGLHSPSLGLGIIMVLLIAIAITIVLFDRLSRLAAILLVPLLLWVCFATGLNFAIWFLNRGS
jgi:tryptophan-rich sensory protein